MYQILCDDSILYDPRDDELILLNPKCKLEVNTVCEGSFSILPTHPYYDKLKKLKSIFEIKQNDDVIFRGRMTEDSRDFDNLLNVDLEGVLSFANDSIIPPFNFPSEFPEAEKAENMVEYFLNWILEQHNNQVENWQKLKLGKVTVADPNNFISRSNTDYASTWDTLKSKLFDSALGGYLICRYEADGNYIDYLSEFELTNTQRITLEENLLDISITSDATETYSAILPIGAEIEKENGTKAKLTLESLEDGDITSDLVKKGKFIYSRSAVAENGWRCIPPAESNWDDVTEVVNLRSKAIEQLTGTALLLLSTISIKAVDLGFSDEEIQSFRYGRNVVADIPTHGIMDKIYPLSTLDIDILNPQSTGIVLGDTVRTLTDINEKDKADTITRVETAERDIAENREEVTVVKNQVINQSTEIVNTCNSIVMAAMEDYVATGDYEEFKQSVNSQFELFASELNIKFSESISQIENVNGDLQEKFNTITKYFTFEIDGLTIGQVDNPNKVVIDNDEISILVNGAVVQKFDAEGKALIPELTITKLLNLLGFYIDKDSVGNINCEYIGGEG